MHFTTCWPIEAFPDAAPDGTLFTDFLPALTCTTTTGTTLSAGFAGHCDWRPPTILELVGLVAQPVYPCTVSPCIDPVFGPTIDATSEYYTTSTSDVTIPTRVWAVTFGSGSSNGPIPKLYNYRVRVVRNAL